MTWRAAGALKATERTGRRLVGVMPRNEDVVEQADGERDNVVMGV